MAQYKTGTVTVTNGSAVVTGIGTEFQTNGIAVGHRWARNGDNVTYAIASVDSETQITLNSPYAGVTNASAVYTIGKDVTVHNGYPLLFSGDIETATFLSYAIQRIDEDIAQSLDGEFISFNSSTGTIAATSVSGAIRELEDAISGATTGHLVLLGQAGGQQAYGGIDAGDNLTFNSTSNATKGLVILGSSTGLVYNETLNKVGINEINPEGKLHITDSASGANVTPLVIQNDTLATGTEVSIRFAPTTAPDVRYAAISGINASGTNIIDLAFTTGSGATITEKMRLTGSGNLGVGTSTPGIDVAGGTLDLSGVIIHAYNASAGSRLISEGAPATVEWIDLAGASNDKWIQSKCTTGLLTFRSLNDSGSARNDNLLVMDMGSGWVGIGESAPLGKLHVKSTDAGTTTIDVNADEIVIENSGNTGLTMIGSTGGTCQLQMGYPAFPGLTRLFANNASGYLAIYTNNAEKMRIDTNGLVGIGTPSATYKLQIIHGSETSASGGIYLGGLNGSGTGLTINSNTRSVGEKTTKLLSIINRVNLPSLTVDVQGNVSIAGSGSFGGGEGVLSIINRVTAPTSNPTGGGILYTESGALKYRGSSGTITTIAVA